MSGGINKTVLEIVNDIQYSDCDIKILSDALKKCPNNVNEKNYFGHTALMSAVVKGRSDIVDLLLQCESIDVNTQNKDKQTVLMYSAIFNRTKVCLKLLQFDTIDLELKHHSGRTALMWAFSYGHVYIIKILLRHGAKYKGWENWEIDSNKKQQIYEIMEKKQINK